MYESTPSKIISEIVNLNSSQIFSLIGGLQFEIAPEHEVIDLLLQGNSFLRWGDGETALSRGKSIRFQSSSPALQKSLVNIWENPAEKTIVGLSPYVRDSVFPLLANKALLFKVHFSSRVFLSSRLQKYQMYSSTTFWYEKWNKLPEVLRELGKNRSVLLVAGDSEYLRACPRGTSFISVPSVNAFEEYESIKAKISLWLSNQTIIPIVYLAAGPLSKVLIQDFSRNFQLIDIGHAFNFYKYGELRYAWHN